MGNVWILLLLGFGFYYLKRWLAGKAMHHPELQTVDALDRILHGVFVVVTVWIVVTWVNHWISAALFLQFGTHSFGAH